MVQLAFGRACGGSVAQRCGVGGRACGGSVAQRCGIRIAHWLVIVQLESICFEKSSQRPPPRTFFFATVGLPL